MSSVSGLGDGDEDDLSFREEIKQGSVDAELSVDGGKVFEEEFEEEFIRTSLCNTRFMVEARLLSRHENAASRLHFAGTCSSRVNRFVK